jgi:REP element-mobilizing transposase RayT
MRRARDLQENAKYHVTARAGFGKMPTDCRVVKPLFLEVLAQAREKFDFTVGRVSIRGDQFHLTIHPGRDSSLAGIMKWILQTFASRYNRANGLWGHFWGGRYISRIVTRQLPLSQNRRMSILSCNGYRRTP